MKLPPLSANGKVFIVGSTFPPKAGGSAVVMRELLRNFDPDSFEIFTVKARNRVDWDLENRVTRAIIEWKRPSRLAVLIRILQMPLYLVYALYRLKISKAKYILAVYPSIEFLFLATMMANFRRDIKFCIYMHDTLVEALSNSRLSMFASGLQKCAFKRANSIMVMSDGMRELYNAKYRLNTMVVSHIYSDKIADKISDDVSVKKQLFFGGGVYAINDRAIGRIVEAAKLLGVNFVFTAKNRDQCLRNIGVSKENTKCVETVYLETRDQYLSALRVSGILVLALNFPDESKIGRDELATIFPTKTPEYLASGSPIIVHCPNNYFLAKFFEENKCGVLVCERDINKIVLAIEDIFSNSQKYCEFRNAALKAARMFDPQRISCSVNI